MRLQFVHLKNAKPFLSSTLRLLTLYFKKFFATKTLILISKNKIRNFEISSSMQFFSLIFAILIANLCYRSVFYDDLLNQKTIQISKLEKANNKFQKEIISINKNLEKINAYFIEAANYEGITGVGSNIRLHGKGFDNLFADLNLDKSDKKTAIEIASAKAILDNIKNLAKRRISNLENKVALTGINVDDATFQNANLTDVDLATSLNDGDGSHQGGPLQLAVGNGEDMDENFDVESIKTDNEIDYLANLEKFIYHAPLGKPMKGYYVSSVFGKRVDPIKRIIAIHHGLDLVGRDNSPISSPSIGEVRFAGTFGNYGKTVIIDHGYGITTRYGHLSQINVKVGDIVKKGDVIALQGNSGRSTGDHLHYEVRYNDRPLDPRNFLKAGERIFEKRSI